MIELRIVTVKNSLKNIYTISKYYKLQDPNPDPNPNTGDLKQCQSMKAGTTKVSDNFFPRFLIQNLNVPHKILLSVCEFCCMKFRESKSYSQKCRANPSKKGGGETLYTPHFPPSSCLTQGQKTEISN